MMVQVTMVCSLSHFLYDCHRRRSSGCKGVNALRERERERQTERERERCKCKERGKSKGGKRGWDAARDVAFAQSTYSMQNEDEDAESAGFDSQ